jgi:hypothetical protein
MKVDNCALPVAAILENVSGTFGEDAYTDCNDDDYSRPEEGLKTVRLRSLRT